MTTRRKFRLALTGDSMVQRRLLTREDATLRPLFDLIRGADVSFRNLEVVPNDFIGPRFAAEDEARRILDSFARLSKPFGTHFDRGATTATLTI